MPVTLLRPRAFAPEQTSDPAAGPALLANDLGTCLARTDWQATRALVRSDEGSTDERAVLAGLTRHIAGCVPPGRKLTLDIARLRAILAETVYHAMVADERGR